MIRHLGWIFIYIGCLGSAAASAEKVGPGPICIYNSRSFSDGAYICVQKSLMLTCAVEGSHATWKPVLDGDLKERCTVPMMPDAPLRTHSHRRHALLRKDHPVAEGPAKCFTFNDNRYCE